VTLGELADVLEAAARRARELEAEQRSELRTWTDQTTSPLGRRRHVAAVRRRLAAGLDGVAVIGRRHLLAPAALDAELSVLSRRAPVAEKSTRARLERRLGLVGEGRS
jgi:hypothetical protein